MNLCSSTVSSFSDIKTEPVEDLIPCHDYLRILIDDQQHLPEPPKAGNTSSVEELVTKFAPLDVRETKPTDCSRHDQIDDGLSEDSDWYVSENDLDEPAPAFPPFARGGNHTFNPASELLNRQFFLGYEQGYIVRVYCWGVDPAAPHVTHIYRVDLDGTFHPHTTFYHYPDSDFYRQALGQYFCWNDQKIYFQMANEMYAPEPSTVYATADQAFQVIAQQSGTFGPLLNTHPDNSDLLSELPGGNPKAQSMDDGWPGQRGSGLQEISALSSSSHFIHAQNDEAPSTVSDHGLPGTHRLLLQHSHTLSEKSLEPQCPTSPAHAEPLKGSLDMGVPGVEPAALSPRNSSLDSDLSCDEETSAETHSVPNDTLISSASGSIHATKAKNSRKLPGKYFAAHTRNGPKRLKKIIDDWVNKYATEHPGDLECPEPEDICNSTPRRPHALKTDLYGHYGIRPFKCQRCRSQRFLTSSGLKKHIGNFHICPGCEVELPRAQLKAHKRSCNRLLTKRAAASGA